MNKPLTKQERQEISKLLKCAIQAYVPSKYISSLIYAVDQLEVDPKEEFKQLFDVAQEAPHA